MATTHSKGRIYQNPRQWLECLEDRRLLSATTASLHSITVEPQIVVNASDTSGTSTNSGYTPAQIKTAYDLNNITFNGGFDTGNGSGQTIAIVDAYNVKSGVPAPPVGSAAPSAPKPAPKPPVTH